ncbi:DNA internalization-related competence protein ComEC/Rec2 [Crenobacter intestini]|uniref:DNA internalization-related competence protein ComEC/Rec2 n=1 Tax=Crenobacter intestini TaxID=2563443 RepID=A0A4T0UKF7_9NEIS|nr:DNA internalization-related competence protein ComEC/Rec2 [Crenobacter intestini]TIC79037.1 DNA internalization-related competence protein ComEC/Rec2 [Crenobacter intestini]
MDRLAAFCLGIALTALLPALPSSAVLLLALPVLLLLFALAPVARTRWLASGAWLLAACLLGFAWAAWRAELRLADALLPAREGVPTVVVGEVASLPVAGEFATRFRLRVLAAPPGVPDTVLVSDYRRRAWPAGSVWQTTLRLRAPRGVANPVGFDAEAWYWSEGIGATATVGKAREPMGEAPWWRAGVDRVREAALARIRRELGEGDSAALIGALTVGAQGALSPGLWQTLRQTGTVHLISISGVHVTMLAALAAWLALALTRRFGGGATPRVWVALAALAAALLYSALAGFALPTVRTLLALSAATLFLLARRQTGVFTVWWAVLALVLLVDPFAVLAPGVWLSFGLVGALLWGGFGRKPQSGWRQALAGQWAIALVSPLPLLWLFGELPLVSAPANLVAIPWVTLLLAPLSLLALILPWHWPLAACGHLAEAFVWAMQGFAQFPQWSPPALPPPLLLLALPAALLLLLPLGVGWRALAVCLWLPLFLWRPPLPAPGEVEVRMLDVGQGLSLLVRTHGHTLLYDTGAGDAARVLRPQLVALGVRALDTLVLSHDDADHAGAAPTLLATFAVRQVVAGQPERLAARKVARAQPCGRRSWVWDGVRFDLLPGEAGAADDNAASCSLRVATMSRALLVTGDLPQAAEETLAGRYGRALASDVWVAGHHGSRTSSSAALLGVVRPAWALVSAGYRNRYRHPHAEVLARFGEMGVRVKRTDLDGQLTVRLGETVTVGAWRAQAPRYWRAGASEP